MQQFYALSINLLSEFIMDDYFSSNFFFLTLLFLKIAREAESPSEVKTGKYRKLILGLHDVQFSVSFFRTRLIKAVE